MNFQIRCAVPKLSCYEEYPLGGPPHVTGDRDTLGEYHQGACDLLYATDPYHILGFNGARDREGDN